MLRFEVLQAQYGDCFLLRWGDGDDTRVAVIDGGPAGVYQASLKTRLMLLKRSDPTLAIDWAMVSHIDDDHINGLVAMMTELRNIADQNEVPPFRVRRFWFNAFEDLAGVKPGHTAGSVAAVAAVASLGALLPGGALSHETQAVLASVGQGRNLRDALDGLGISDNAPIGGFVSATNAAVDIAGLQVTIVGPLEQQLTDLREKWAKTPLPHAKPDAKAASYADMSVPNLSSIVCHVAFETGGATRTMLLTGDARGDYILDGLEKAGLMPGGTLKLDLLKVQHHGSDRDVVKAFFAQVIADHYVISANGKYNNPDQDTLRWLIEARGADAYTIHLSNELDWMADFFANLQPGHGFKIHYRGLPADNVSIDEINLD